MCLPPRRFSCVFISSVRLSWRRRLCWRAPRRPRTVPWVRSLRRNAAAAWMREKTVTTADEATSQATTADEASSRATTADEATNRATTADKAPSQATTADEAPNRATTAARTTREVTPSTSRQKFVLGYGRFIPHGFVARQLQGNSLRPPRASPSGRLIPNPARTSGARYYSRCYFVVALAGFAGFAAGAPGGGTRPSCIIISTPLP